MVTKTGSRRGMSLNSFSDNIQGRTIKSAHFAVYSVTDAIVQDNVK